MVPARLVVVPGLPLSPQGKIDRRALALARVEDSPPDPAENADYSELEQRLVDILQEMLGRRVGLDDDFFDMGGHSLLAMRVLARVRATFDVDVPLVRFLDRPTARQLAGVVEQIAFEQVERLSEAEAVRLAADLGQVHERS